MGHRRQLSAGDVCRAATCCPKSLERRITFPDVIRAIAEQCGDLYRENDFLPLPCAHPNCHSLCYAYRSGDAVVPLARFIDAENHLESACQRHHLHAPRPRTDRAIPGQSRLLQRRRLRQRTVRDECRATSCRSSRSQPAGDPIDSIASEFFSRTSLKMLSPEDVFRITITSFLDAYNFDVRQAMKDCVHFVLTQRPHHSIFSLQPALSAGLVHAAATARRFHHKDTKNTKEEISLFIQM